MMSTAYVPIPAVFINQTNGEALRDYVQGQPTNSARIRYTPATVSLVVTQAVICEHVGVKLNTTAPARGDLRIGLVSPSGTRSVLQAMSTDASPAPADWIYWSVQHFYEPSVGTWRLEISNERSTNTGSVSDAQLLIQGVPIVDSDHDGLDDNWEMARLGTLGYGPADDPDGDGYSNAREQCLDTDPLVYDPVLGADLSFWDDRLVRAAFPAVPNRTYQLRVSSGLDQPSTVITNLAGRLPEVEVFAPYYGTTNEFFNAVRSP
jgi:subtilisin-like proprotein convertase family protein